MAKKKHSPRDRRQGPTGGSQKSQRSAGADPFARGSSGDPERDMDDREALLTGSLEQVFEVFEAAIDDGLATPVVILLDCEDELGGAMARELAGAEEVDAEIEANRFTGVPDLRTTLGVALSFEEARGEIPITFPYLAESFAKSPGDDSILTVVVAHGGAGTFSVPFDSRPEDSDDAEDDE